MRLMIAVPCLDFVDTPFAECLLALTRRLDREGTDYEVRFARGTLVYYARDRLAYQAVHEGFTHVLWLDSDGVFSDDILEKLSRSGKKIVSGLCRGRHGKHELCVFKCLYPVEAVETVPDSLFMVDACGFAAVLTEVSVLREAFAQSPDSIFSPTQEFGEDLQFCVRAQKLGYRVYCEPEVQIGHIGQTVIWPDNYRHLNTHEKEGEKHERTK